MAATMAAARCVRGLWTNPVLSMTISTRLTAQRAGLFQVNQVKFLEGLELSGF